MNNISNGLISVIIPVYNVERYLEKAINSVLRQDYQNYEIILVDDGSTDSSPEICDRFNKENSKIKVIHKSNGGLSSARNTGLDIASGEYIFFLDSDDYISSDCFSSLLKSIKTDNSDMALGNICYVNNSYCPIDELNMPSPITNEVISGLDLLEKMAENEAKFYSVAWNKLYKKNLFDDIRFPVGELHEDEAIAHKIAFKCSAVSCIEKRIYFYVQHAGTIMSSKYSVKNLASDKSFYNRVLFLQERNLNMLAEKTAFFALDIGRYSIKNSYISGIYNQCKPNFKKWFGYEYRLCKNLINKNGIKFKLYYFVIFKITKVYLLILKLFKKL